ncbi:MAG: hypothetical protein WC962_07900 [Phycisphaerae bacterium]|jgi:hypothetical protein
MTENLRQTVDDPGIDILSHKGRTKSVHILTLDQTLADDVQERINTDKRTKNCIVHRPVRGIIHGVEEINEMAVETVSSRLLIIDVRKTTLPALQQSYNKVVGYNRRDLNHTCYIILIGDGPISFLSSDNSIDAFVPYLTKHRLDYYPAAYFYDPFIHYEPDEIPRTGVDLAALVPSMPPKRLAYYFKEQEKTVADIRTFFRAADKPQKKKRRTEKLTDLYKRQAEKILNSAHHKADPLFTHDGLQISTETMHLYPLFFEDWVSELLDKAANPQQ